MSQHDQLTTTKRNPWLDVLRGLAILLVLFNHADTRTMIGEVGWLGVDLFFVLSGYLISRLLFVEYQQTNGIRPGRFIVRRALRIMPAFYVFVAFSLAYAWWIKGHSFDINRIFAEVFYIQNYARGIWVHTWSLAVEEQFYITFVLLMLVLTKGNVIDKGRLIITLLSLFWSTVVFLKFRHVNSFQGTDPFFFVETHLRSEGIVLGVLLGYLVTFYPNRMKLGQYGRWKVFFTSLALMASVVPLHLAGSHLMNSWGISLANLGFMGLVWLAIELPSEVSGRSAKLQAWLIKRIGFLGIHSYGIYLWHLNVRGLMRSFFPEQGLLATVLYFTLAVIIGWLATTMIEKPVMNWRNQRWPRMS